MSDSDLVAGRRVTGQTFTAAEIPKELLASSAPTGYAVTKTIAKSVTVELSGTGQVRCKDRLDGRKQIEVAGGGKVACFADATWWDCLRHVYAHFRENGKIQD
jgi:hypothetical protein